MSLPIFQRTIVDSSGNIQPGASVAVRNETTGDLVPIFADREGGTAKANPFLADSEGFATFYVEPGEYQVTATTPAGTITWSHVAIGDTALLQLSQPTGSALVGFQQPGGVARTVEGKLREIVSAEDYGALPGGSASANTLAIQKALNSGASDVEVNTPGVYEINDTLLLPESVKRVKLADGATIMQTVDKAIWYKAGTLESGIARFPTSSIEIGATGISLTAPDIAAFSVGDWLLIRSGDLTPNVTAGSRVAMLRRVQAITGQVRVDAAFYRAMSLDVGGSALQLRKAFLGGRVVFEGGTYSAAVQAQSNRTALFDFLLCYSPDFDRVTIQDSGGTAIRLAHCVGGTFSDSHISNLRDDRDNGHFGYGVMLAGATRGFHFASGSAYKCRHAITTASVFTTTLGYEVARALPAEFINDLQGRGEPESCHYGPVYVYGTTNAGLDTHEQGFGITITPNVHGCFDGVLIRNSDATINGGQIVNCRRTGVRVDFASSNPAATVTSNVAINGLTIKNVALDGTDSIGLDLEAVGAKIYANDLTVTGYSLAGAVVDPGVFLSVKGGVFDALNPAVGAGYVRGLWLQSGDNIVFGVTLRNNWRGIDVTGVSGTKIKHVSTSGNTTDVYPNTFLDATNDHDVPFNFARAGRYGASGSFGATGTSSTLTSGTLRCAPFYLKETATIDRIGAEITSAGSSGALLRIGIYADDGNGYPGERLIDAEPINAASVGSQEIAIDLTLRPGLYWFAGAVQGNPTTQPTVITTTASSYSVTASSLTNALAGTVGYAMSGVPSTFPVNFASGQNSTSVAPKIAVRFA